jgi:hypothetical protein
MLLLMTRQECMGNKDGGNAASDGIRSVEQDELQMDEEEEDAKSAMMRRLRDIEREEAVP